MLRVASDEFMNTGYENGSRLNIPIDRVDSSDGFFCGKHCVLALQYWDNRPEGLEQKTTHLHPNHHRWLYYSWLNRIHDTRGEKSDIRWWYAILFLESDIIFSYSMLDLSRAVSPVQIGILLLSLIVNEVSASSKWEGATDTSIKYLCISTLLSHLTHIVAGFFLFCAIMVLALIIYQPVSLRWSLYERFPTKNTPVPQEHFACVIHFWNFIQSRLYSCAVYPFVV